MPTLLFMNTIHFRCFNHNRLKTMSTRRTQEACTSVARTKEMSWRKSWRSGMCSRYPFWNVYNYRPFNELFCIERMAFANETWQLGTFTILMCSKSGVIIQANVKSSSERATRQTPNTARRTPLRSRNSERRPLQCLARKHREMKSGLPSLSV